MKLLLSIIVSTNSFHFYTTAFTAYQRSPFPRGIIHKSTTRVYLADASSDEEVPPSNANDDEITNDTFQTTSTTTTTSQTQSTLFAKKELYVGETFEKGETIYSDLEASAEIFVENEVEMKIDNGGAIEDASKIHDTTIDVKVEDTQSVVQTDQIETTASDSVKEPVIEDGPSIVEKREEEEPTAEVVEPITEDYTPPITEESGGEDISTINDTPSVTEEEEEEVIEDESNMDDAPFFISEEEDGLSEDDNLSTDRDDENNDDVGDGKVIMAAERVEKALRYQVLAAEEAQRNFEEARAEAIRRAQALTPLKEQVSGAEKGKELTKETKDDSADRAEAILRTRMLLDEEMADEAATDDSLIGSIRAFFAPRKGGIKDTKAARKRSKFVQCLFP